MYEQWNRPATNVVKVLVAFIGFLEMGANDSAVGAILPFIEKYYDLSDFLVSFIFLGGVIGSLSAALTSGILHLKTGRRGASLIGIGCQFVGFTLIAFFHSRYIQVLLSYLFIGFGGGYLNGSWNAWIGAFENPHGILGVLHGCYALGGMLGPSIVAFLFEKGQEWFSIYRLLVIYSGVVLVCAAIVFKNDTAKQYEIDMHNHGKYDDDRDDNTDNNDTRSDSDLVNSVIASSEEGRMFGDETSSLLHQCPSYSSIPPHGQEVISMDQESPFNHPAVWILALFLCTYNGIEMGYSGWIVTYMIRVRQGDPKLMGLVSTSFWTGLTLGRVVLGFVTGKFRSLTRGVLYYFLGALAFHCIFWLGSMNDSSNGSTIFVDALCVAMVGFFIGPIYPSAMIMATGVLPPYLHVPGISASCALSGCGAALFPLFMGAIIQQFGMQVLPLIIVASMILAILLWVTLSYQGSKNTNNSDDF